MYITVFGVMLALFVLILIYRWQGRKTEETPHRSLSLVHELCSENVVNLEEAQKKDNLDEHLDELTQQLAEKESRLFLSKSKIREAQCEIENLHSVEADVSKTYQGLLDALRSDLVGVEKECRKLQDQIEWVSRKRGEIKEEIQQGHQRYGEAAVELASNLIELQKGRVVFDNRQPQYSRTRKKENFPIASPYNSLIFRPSQIYSDESRLISSIVNKPQTRYSGEQIHKEPTFPSTGPYDSMIIKSSPNYSEDSMRLKTE